MGAQMKNQQLPFGWDCCRLGDILQPSKERVDPNSIDETAYIGLEHIEKDTGKLLGHGNSSEVRSSKTKFFEGDLLYGKLRPYLNKVHVASFAGVCSTDILVFPKNKYVSNKYLLFRFLQADFVRFANLNVSGVQHPRVDFKKLADFVIPIAPLPEQQRIVARIEEFFSHLDAGVEALQKAKAQLQRYHQAVLKAAVEGRLTAEWRKAHPEVEPAETLLKYLRNKKRQDSIYNSKNTPRLQELNLSLIPNSWVWTNIYEISESMKNGIYKQRHFYNDNGIACLRMYNIDRGRIVWKDIKRMQLTSEEIREYELRPGDILINRVNSRELVGKAAVIRNNPELCVFESKNIRLRLLDKFVNSQFINIWFLIFNQKYFNHNAQQTVGMASINQDQLGSMPVPLPPLSEQQIIVKKTESLLATLTESEDAIIKSQNYSGCLRQSILKLAFEGKLVPQNSYDEPASILLERITAERANNAIIKGCRIKRSNTHQMRLTQ